MFFFVSTVVKQLFWKAYCEKNYEESTKIKDINLIFIYDQNLMSFVFFILVSPFDFYHINLPNSNYQNFRIR